MRSALSIVVVAALTVFLSLGEVHRSEARLVALDIGQGDAIYIRTPAGQDLVVDTGPSARVVEQLTRQMPRGDHTIELLVLSHLDADHIGGTQALLGAFVVERLAINGDPPKTETAQAMFDLVESKGLTPEILQRGQRLESPGVVLDVVWPPAESDVLGNGFEPGNERSLVVRLATAKQTVLLTGDATVDVERAMLTEHTWLESDVLKVGHHGSKTSTGAELLKATTPAQAVISVGANNRYGHPTSEALERLRDAGVPYVRTDEQGPITLPL